MAIGRFDPNNRISVPVPNPGALPYDAADINLEGFEESTIGASTEDVFSPEEEPRERYACLMSLKMKLMR